MAEIQCLLLKIAGLTGGLVEDMPEAGRREWQAYVNGFEQLQKWAAVGAGLAAQVRDQKGGGTESESVSEE